MKNLFFSLMVTLSAMFMNAQSYNIDPADYGRYHNEFVDLFEKSGRSFSNYTSYSAFLTDFQQIVNAKYPNFATNADIAQINSRFMTDIMNPQTMRNLAQNINQLLSDRVISQTLHDGMIAIINSGSHQAAQQICTDLQMKGLAPAEKDSVTAVQSILNSSNEYWSKKRFDNGAQVIVADAVGGFIWFYAGPFAVLAGGAYSLAVYYCSSCN